MSAAPRQEEWKPVAGREGAYEVSSHGRVRSLDREIRRKNRWGEVKGFLRKGRVLIPRSRHGGYVAVTLSRKGKDRPIHHLVLFAFVGPRPKHSQANHKNGIKTDNSVKNLEWVTNKENRQHAIRMGLHKSNGGQTWRQLSPIEVLNIRKEYGKVQSSVLAKKFGVSQTTISRIGLRQTFGSI